MKTFLALLCAFAAPLQADDYEIRFSRLHKAAGSLGLTAKVTLDSVRTFSAGGQVMREDKMDIKAMVAGDVEILSAAKNGAITAVKFTVGEWKGEGDEDAAGLFQKGDVIEFARGAESEDDAKVNGKEASDKQEQVAELFLPLDAHGGITRDDVFGPGRKVKSGEEWPLSRKSAATEAEAAGIFGTKPENFSGSTKLAAIAEHEGQKCAELTSTITFQGTGFTLRNAPPTLKVKTLTADSVSQSWLPLDEASPFQRHKYSSNADMNAAGEMEGPDDGVVIGLSIHRKAGVEVAIRPK